ncbi:MAG: two pore domain potassium channel family protein, partial [Actinobacteria bacterium]|nr:two pore domain potassium channel family protein [Actinomycetota bacterium]
YISAVQITIAERGAEGSNIKDFGDGIWWAFTTVTTVGYGDRFPITGEGRFLAVLLMIMGISLVGVITASVASWFVKMSNNETTKPPL